MPKITSRAETTIRSGAFKKPIKIQKPVDTRDSMGGSVRTWANYISTMAKITPWKGKEGIVGQQTYPTRFSRFYIRYRPSENIDDSMRIVYRDQIYNIRSILVIEEEQTNIEILAEEQQAKGSL
jgi:phage head-tail adaptor, putative, SPP1 family